MLYQSVTCDTRDQVLILVYLTTGDNLQMHEANGILPYKLKGESMCLGHSARLLSQLLPKSEETGQAQFRLERVHLVSLWPQCSWPSVSASQLTTGTLPYSRRPCQDILTLSFTVKSLLISLPVLPPSQSFKALCPLRSYHPSLCDSNRSSLAPP